MLNRHRMAAVILVSSLIFSTTPSFAGNIIAEIAVRALARGISEGLGSAIAGSQSPFASASAYAPIVAFAPAQDYSSASWYRNWLAARQNGSPAALYNQPCTMSDGQREMAVPCQMVALAISGQPALAEPRGAGPAEPDVDRRPPARARSVHRSVLRASYDSGAVSHGARLRLR
jgi:hypothetical protein